MDPTKPVRCVCDSGLRVVGSWNYEGVVNLVSSLKSCDSWFGSFLVLAPLPLFRNIERATTIFIFERD